MGARDLLDDLAGAGISIVVDGDRLVIRPASKVTDTMRAALREAKPELLAILAERPRPYRLARVDADVAHAEAWDDAAIACFQARVGQFLKLGFGATDADDVAERLHLRDLHADYRHLCLECRNVAGDRCTGWRCRNHRRAQVARELAHDLVLLPQRCPGFKT